MDKRSKKLIMLLEASPKDMKMDKKMPNESSKKDIKADKKMKKKKGKC